MMRSFFLTLLLIASLPVLSQSDCPPFWHDIQQFKKADSVQPPPGNAILFVGSSSFTKWQDVQDYFPGYTIINRGFGGSQLTDVIRYAYDVILPYAPKQVVIYCGENDLASPPSMKAETVVQRFKTLFGIIRTNLPHTNISFISAKPSPSRTQFFTEMKRANQQIEAFLKKQKNAAFINVYHAMLNEKGIPQQEIFLDDNLHMNAKGYKIWQRIILPYLKK